MSKVWKTVKVFISSTFLDLELERDQLAHVFDEIEKRMLERQLSIRVYDLRWRDRHSKEPITDWCLRMVKECDYFIGILGNRYGWRPFANTSENKASVTEMEINTALDCIPAENRFFCFTNVNSENVETPEDLAAITHLKKHLTNQGEKIYQCSDVPSMLNSIQQEFNHYLDQNYPKNEKVELEQHSYQDSLLDIIAEKRKGFIGRISPLQTLRDFAFSQDVPNYLSLYAVAGTGKSALLAHFIHQWQEDIPIIAHFMSMSSDSREIRGIYQSLAEQLKLLNLIAPQKNSSDLGLEVREALEKVSSPLILIIDGLDEVASSDTSLSWLPRSLPPNIRIILTTRPVDTVKTLDNYPSLQKIEIQPLAEGEIKQIIASYEAEHQLQLSSEDCELLLKRAAGNPLFLKVALDEVATSGIAIGQLALTVDMLFDQILERLEKELQKKFERLQINLSAQEILNQYLGSIAAGRAGILEKELQEILAIEHDIFLSITKALSHFIVTRKHLLQFFHPEFERTIKIRYGKGGMRKYHEVLAAYLENKGYRYHRTLSELPFQLQWSKNYTRLLITLTDIKFLSQKSNAGMIIPLREDFHSALNNPEVSIPQDLREEIIPEVYINVKILELLARIFAIESTFLQRHPGCLFQILWNYGYWHDCPEAEQHYKNGSDELAPWKQDEDKMYRLVELWRQQQNPESIWWKSKRPLPFRIDLPLNKIFRGHTSSVNRVAFSHDGKFVASASEDKTIRVWDTETGTCFYVLKGHSDIVSGVAFNHCDSQIVSSSYDGKIKVWNVENGQLIYSMSPQKPVYDVCYRPNSQQITSAQVDGSICLWENKSCTRTLQLHKDQIDQICYRHDGLQLASASLDGSVCIYNFENDTSISLLWNAKVPATSVAYHPEGKEIVVGYANSNIFIWNIEKQESTKNLVGHQWKIHSVDYSHSGDKIVSSSQDGKLRVWNNLDGQCIQKIPVHERHVLSAKFHPEQNLIASGSFDKTVRISKVDPQVVDLELIGHERIVTSFCSSSGKNWMVTHALDEKVLYWDTQTGLCRWVWQGNDGKIPLVSSTPGYEKDLINIDVSDDGNEVTAGFNNGRVCTWNTNTGELIREFVGHQGWVKCVRYAPNKKYIATGADDLTIKVWNIEDQRCIATLSGHDRSITSLDFSPNSRNLISGSLDCGAILWDIETEKLICTFQADSFSAVNCVQYHPSGEAILTCSDSGTLALWDNKTKVCIKKLEDHPEVKRVMFSLQGNAFYSASRSFLSHYSYDSEVNSFNSVKTNGWSNPRYFVHSQFRVISHDAETALQSSSREEYAWFPYILDNSKWLTKNLLGGYNEHHAYLLELVAPQEFLSNNCFESKTNSPKPALDWPKLDQYKTIKAQLPEKQNQSFWRNFLENNAQSKKYEPSFIANIATCKSLPIACSTVLQQMLKDFPLFSYLRIVTNQEQSLDVIADIGLLDDRVFYIPKETMNTLANEQTALFVEKYEDSNVEESSSIGYALTIPLHYPIVNWGFVQAYGVRESGTIKEKSTLEKVSNEIQTIFLAVLEHCSPS